MTTITFYPPDAAPLIATLRDVEPRDRDFTIRVAVPFDGWRRIQAESLFHGWFEEGDLPEFEEAGQIFLTLRLSPPLAQRLDASVSSVEALATLNRTSDNLLFNTLAWFLMAATQAVPLPPHLQTPGASLNVGAATRWQRLFHPPSVVTPTPQEVVTGFFREQEWLYEELKPTLWRLSLTGDAGDIWTVLVQIDLEHEFCSVYSVMPTTAEDEEKRTDLAAYLCGENYDLAIGNWEMDFDDGEIRFRTSLDYEGGILTPALFARLVMMNLQAAESTFADIQARL